MESCGWLHVLEGLSAMILWLFLLYVTVHGCCRGLVMLWKVHMQVHIKVLELINMWLAAAVCQVDACDPAVGGCPQQLAAVGSIFMVV